MIPDIDLKQKMWEVIRSEQNWKKVCETYGELLSVMIDTGDKMSSQNDLLTPNSPGVTTTFFNKLPSGSSDSSQGAETIKSSSVFAKNLKIVGFKKRLTKLNDSKYCCTYIIGRTVQAVLHDFGAMKEAFTYDICPLFGKLPEDHHDFCIDIANPDSPCIFSNICENWNEDNWGQSVQKAFQLLLDEGYIATEEVGD